MAEDKDELVDEQALDRMPVAPPRPPAAAERDGDKSGNGRSGVDDQDPLSAHPT
jgi:hypothetical protein